jgi:hypothetical protein
MKTTKLLIVLISSVVFAASAAWTEYKLVLHSGIAFSLFAGVAVLVALRGALRRAPEGYEDDDGFHVSARREQTERARDARLSQPTRALKMDMARLFSRS